MLVLILFKSHVLTSQFISNPIIQIIHVYVSDTADQREIYPQ